MGWSCDVVGKKVYMYFKKDIPEAQTTCLNASFGLLSGWQMVCEVCAEMR